MMGAVTRVVTIMLPLVLLGLPWVSLGHGADMENLNTSVGKFIDCEADLYILTLDVSQLVYL